MAWWCAGQGRPRSRGSCTADAHSYSLPQKSAVRSTQPIKFFGLVRPVQQRAGATGTRICAGENSTTAPACTQPARQIHLCSSTNPRQLLIIRLASGAGSTSKNGLGRSAAVGASTAAARVDTGILRRGSGLACGLLLGLNCCMEAMQGLCSGNDWASTIFVSWHGTDQNRVAAEHPGNEL